MHLSPDEPAARPRPTAVTVDDLVACPDCGRVVLDPGRTGHRAEAIWLPVDLDAVAAARRHAAAVLTARGVDASHLDDVVLLVSELATDVVRQPGPGFFGVVVDLVDGRVSVDVRVLTLPDPPEPEAAEADPPTGTAGVVAPASRWHREAIIETLADEWGIARSRRSTTSWFTLALPTATPER